MGIGAARARQKEESRYAIYGSVQCKRQKREGTNHMPEHCNGTGVRNVFWFQFEWVWISAGISEYCAADKHGRP